MDLTNARKLAELQEEFRARGPMATGRYKRDKDHPGEIFDSEAGGQSVDPFHLLNSQDVKIRQLKIDKGLLENVIEHAAEELKKIARLPSRVQVPASDLAALVHGLQCYVGDHETGPNQFLAEKSLIEKYEEILKRKKPE